jgi:nascent polypeptide-associated complex subunit alpha
MPELTELDKATASMTERREASGSGTESDSDESIPELEDADKGQGQFPGSTVSCIDLSDTLITLIWSMAKY